MPESPARPPLAAATRSVHDLLAQVEEVVAELKRRRAEAAAAGEEREREAAARAAAETARREAETARAEAQAREQEALAARSAAETARREAETAREGAAGREQAAVAARTEAEDAAASSRERADRALTAVSILREERQATRGALRSVAEGREETPPGKGAGAPAEGRMASSGEASA